MRLLSLFAAAGLAATGVVVTAPAASAASSCSLYVASKFSIGQPYRAITVNEGPNCAAAGVTDAAWFAYHPTQGLVEGAVFENSARSDVVDLYSSMPLGKWTWRPDGAFRADFSEVFQYTTYTDVRLASYGRVVATRTGAKVNLKTTARRYWAGGDKFINWSSARGQLQYRVNGGTVWHPLKTVYSNTSGAYSYTYTIANTRDYRVVFNAVSTIWDSTSPSVRK